MENFSTGRHYCTEIDIAVDISSPYSLKKLVFTTHPVQITPSKFPTHFLNVEIETVLGVCDLHSFNRNYHRRCTKVGVWNAFAVLLCGKCIIWGGDFNISCGKINILCGYFNMWYGYFNIWCSYVNIRCNDVNI